MSQISDSIIFKSLTVDQRPVSSICQCQHQSKSENQNRQGNHLKSLTGSPVFEKSRYQVASQYLQIKEPYEKKETTQNKLTSNQIRLIFEYYEQYGTQWSLILKQFSTKLNSSQFKTQNDIKNRFYGFFKKIFRHLFKNFGNKTGKIVKHITSIQTIKIYEGSQKYRKFKGFIKKFFEQIDYEIQKHRITKFINKNQLEIKQLYEIILQEKLQHEKKEEKKKKRASQLTHQRPNLINHSTTQKIIYHNNIISPTFDEPFYFLQYKSYFDFLAVTMISNVLNIRNKQKANL